jgi:hypothetical protein
MNTDLVLAAAQFGFAPGVRLSRSGKASEGMPAEALDTAGSGHHAKP